MVFSSFPEALSATARRVAGPRDVGTVEIVNGACVEDPINSAFK